MAEYRITVQRDGEGPTVQTRKRVDAARQLFVSEVWNIIRAYAGLDTGWGHDAYWSAINRSCALGEAGDRATVTINDYCVILERAS